MQFVAGGRWAETKLQRGTLTNISLNGPRMEMFTRTMCLGVNMVD